MACRSEQYSGAKANFANVTLRSKTTIVRLPSTFYKRSRGGFVEIAADGDRSAFHADRPLPSAVHRVARMRKASFICSG